MGLEGALAPSRSRALACVAVLGLAQAVQAAESAHLSTEAIPYQTEEVPDRPEPLVELGEPFLGSGPLGEGITLPTGAVWRPSLLVFGTVRSAFQSFDDTSGSDSRSTEWATRLDLFAQLRLSPTERLVLGLRPLDDEDDFLSDRNDLTGYLLEPGEGDGWETDLNPNVETLFFEGDFTEIFPDLDPEDAKALDFGFSVGRQPLIFQDGLLLDDTIDSVGITRNNLFIPGTSNTRLTLLYGWNEVHRSNNRKDRSARIYGLFSETDARWSTVNVDLVHLDSEDESGDALFAGISFAQRLLHFNTTFRVLGSLSLDADTPEADDGIVIFLEGSWTPPHTHDLVYVNYFHAFDRFSSVARGPRTGGPLGRVGILFAAVGLGRFPAPLSNQAAEAFGASLGYQKFFDDTRKQVVLEVGGRSDTGSSSQSAYAMGARYQQAIGRHIVMVVDTFLGRRETTGTLYGARWEFLLKF